MGGFIALVLPCASVIPIGKGFRGAIIRSSIAYGRQALLLNFNTSMSHALGIYVPNQSQDQSQELMD